MEDLINLIKTLHMFWGTLSVTALIGFICFKVGESDQKKIHEYDA